MRVWVVMIADYNRYSVAVYDNEESANLHVAAEKEDRLYTEEHELKSEFKKDD